MDGDAGPKTLAAYRKVLAEKGPGAIDRAIGLEQVKDAAAGPPAAQGTLGKTLKTAFPSFRNGPAGPVRALQTSLNDLGAETFGRGGFEPLKLDGVPGPKTETAFRRLGSLAGPEKVAGAFGRRLGFLV